MVAATRDEFHDRPSRPPGLVRGPFRFFGGSDRRAGGTWLGVNEKGLISAITNRPGGDDNPERPSRGHVTVAALLQPDVDAARKLLLDLPEDVTPWRIGGSPDDQDLYVEEAPMREYPPPAYNPFNLFVAQGKEGFVAYRDRDLVCQEIEPGVHILTNDHDLDQLPVGGKLEGIEGRDDLVSALKEIVARHDGIGPDRYRICKHGDDRGTVSSTIIAVGESFPEDSLYLHAEGPPCETEFVDLSGVMRTRLG